MWIVLSSRIINSISKKTDFIKSIFESEFGTAAYLQSKSTLGSLTLVSNWNCFSAPRFHPLSLEQASRSCQTFLACEGRSGHTKDKEKKHKKAWQRPSGVNGGWWWCCGMLMKLWYSQMQGSGVNYHNNGGLLEMDISQETAKTVLLRWRAKRWRIREVTLALFK